jgi:CHAT domain-containing protein/Tfp pilus assembly protein PilF
MKRCGILVVVLTVAFALLAAPAWAQAKKDEAERLWEHGEKALNEGRYREARSYYEQSLARCGANQECVASNLNGIGAVYEAQDDDRAAGRYYEQALAAARKSGNRDLIATNLFNTGAVYHRTYNQYDRALVNMEESLRIFRELKDEKSAALTLFTIGKVYNSMGRYDKALPFFSESLQLNKSTGNKQGVAGNLNLIGNVYASLGQYDKPLTYYREALAIQKEIKNEPGIAESSRNIGDAYCNLKEYGPALGYYQEALAIQKRLNLRADLAVTYTNIGAYYKELDQFDRALFYYGESLKIAREQNNEAMIATVMGNIGNVSASLGKSADALSHYRQALAVDQRLGRPQRTAVTQNNIGMEYFRTGRYDLALSYLTEALKTERQINNLHNIAARLNNIGAVYLKQKRYADAERVLNERRELGRRIAKTRLIHAGLIEVYLATGRYDAAMALLRELPPNWRDTRNRRLEYHTQFGQAWKGKGDFRSAAGEFLKAVAIVEEIRSAVAERGEFFAGGGYIDRLTPYRELTAALSEMAIRGDRPERGFLPDNMDWAAGALYYAELSKARTMLEMMAAAARQYDDSQVPQDLRDRESRLAREIAAVESDWNRALGQGEAAVKALADRKTRLTKEQDGLIAQLRRSYPLYAAVRYPTPMPASEIPLMAGEFLLEYSITRDAAYVFAVRKGAVQRIHRIALTRDDLTAGVEPLLASLGGEGRTPYPAARAAELFDKLLSAALKDARPDDKLIIVPDGILGTIPFEALIEKNGPAPVYAGDRRAITYWQSATALALTRLLKPSPAAKVLFAIGNPVYDKSDPRYAAFKQGTTSKLPAGARDAYAFRGLTVVPKPGRAEDAGAWEEVVYPPLPETEDEIRAIAALWGVRPEPPDVLLGIAATETNVKKTRLADYRYLHFATHADLPGKVQGVGEPFIILGQVENQRGDNGLLTMSEVLGLKLRADMVVLSACSTGRGRMTEGEGVANFARAFQHAGARSVVVSLWEVASAAAVDYMKSFYGHLKAGRTKAEAAQSARREIKARYPHPFFWSVFVLYGEG